MQWTDALVPALFAVLAVVELALLDAPGRLAAGVLEVAACGLLVFRRQRPLLVASMAGLLVAAPPWVGPAFEEVATTILIGALVSYSLARWIAGHVGLVGVALTLLALWAGYLFVDDRSHDVTDVVFVLALLAPPYVFGRLVRRLAEHGELLRRQQELVKREAVRAERDRIARDLHDVIAHSVSAMVMQAAAAEDLVRSDPDRAEELLGQVADTGRRALTETGQLLHLIRDTDDELGLAPAPGLASLDELVAEFGDSGLLVDLEVSGLPADLPAGVDVSAYRIAREALTNALRYADDRAVSLQVGVTGAEVRIHSCNRASGRSGEGSGLGLVGLAERVALLGGTLTHGCAADGRFELAAELPLRAGRA